MSLGAYRLIHQCSAKLMPRATYTVDGSAESFGSGGYVLTFGDEVLQDVRTATDADEEGWRKIEYAGPRPVAAIHNTDALLSSVIKTELAGLAYHAGFIG